MSLIARIAVISPLTGCFLAIEGPEPEAISKIEPRTCETGLTADQRFTVLSNIDAEKLLAAPPRFVLDAGDQMIDVETTVGEFGTLTLTPAQLLPADTDLMLRLVEPGMLASTSIPAWMPARYTTRNAPDIRSYRAIEQRVFVSFTQRLDALTVAAAVTARNARTLVVSDATYLDAPGRVVWVELHGATNPVDIVFGTGLRTDRGDAVFDVERIVQVDPAYTLPPHDGCEYFE